jgi:prevent-host-death family protein
MMPDDRREEWVRLIGAYEAKTHLPRLLDEVAKGKSITIAKHGVPVAVLVPVSEARRKGTRDVIEALKQFRRGKKLGGVSVCDLVEEGRRY